MKVLDSNPQKSAALEKKPEIRLQARSVSRGVAIGKIICLYGANRQFFRTSITESAVQSEVNRLKKGFLLSKRQLDKMIAEKRPGLDAGAGIFDFHRMLLEDSSLQTKIENEIAEHKVNAEWAIKLVTDSYIAKYKAIPDESFRDRYIDIEDIAERILAALGGGKQARIRFSKNSIVAARELRPSTLVELGENKISGLITENGGWTSHTSILAREALMPAVTGVKKLFRRIKAGDDVIVDGYRGQIVINPDPGTVEEYAVKAAKFQASGHAATESASGPPMTLDGRNIRLFANSDSPAVYKKAKRLGAQGIGLFRSEFLFNRLKKYPTETEQFRAYREIAELAGDDGIKIRTFDLGIEQLADQNANREKNPALGLRAVRLSLAYRKQLVIQLRALLRASYQHNIDIVVPMVSGVTEITEIKEMLVNERERLVAGGKEVGNPQLGAMIEIPSAVFMVKELAEHTAFLCLGTNDLVQYLLAVDRDNETVSDWFRSLHPAVIRAIGLVLAAGSESEKPVIVCGEMAGSPYYVPILIGLGAVNLSMNANSLAGVRKIIRGIAHEETRLLVDEIKKCSSVEEVEKIVQEHAAKHWLHLYPANFLDLPTR